MSASLCHPIFLTVVACLCLLTGLRYVSSPGYELQERERGFVWPLIVSVVLVFWLGMRPISYLFGDTVNYAFEYRLLEPGLVEMDWHSEWIWQWLEMSCKISGLDVHEFFTIVEAGYVFSVLWAVKRFMPSNPMLGMLFVFSSLMFFTFGTNGLRNGLACHLILLSMAMLFDDRWMTALVLALIAFGIHRSVILPIAGVLTGMYIIKEPRHAIYFWIGSIFASLVAGGAITNFFASLGFDDRMTGYTDSSVEMDRFSHTGFRWDFLLYSSVPVFMAWIVCVKKEVTDNWYNVICIAYCLCNAFWVMVIRSSFSNRFAYLSWFMYPIVIAYPLINMAVWDDQDRKTGLILMGYCGFTVFMQVIFW